MAKAKTTTKTPNGKITKSNQVIVSSDDARIGYGDILNDTRKERFETLTRYERELLDGSEEIALLKTMMYELVEKLDSFEAGVHWKNANAAYAAFNKAMKIGAYDPKRSAVEMENALGELEVALAGGSSYYATLGEIQALAGQIAGLRDKEVKRITAQNNALTVSMAQVWILTIGQIIREEVVDEETKQRIAERLKTVTQTTFDRTNRAMGTGEWDD